MQDMIILKENTNLTKNLYNLKLKSSIYWGFFCYTKATN